jgi:hypothetical protein
LSAAVHAFVTGMLVNATIFACAFLMSRAAAVHAELSPQACIVLYLTIGLQTQSSAPAQEVSSSPSLWQQFIFVNKFEYDPEPPGFWADQ